MPQIRVPLFMVCCELENGAWLGRALGYPGFSAFAEELEDVVADLRRLVIDAICELPAREITQRHAVTTPVVSPVTVRIAPPRPTPAWRNDLNLQFHSVRWQHTPDRVAYIPELDLDVVATGGLSLNQLIDDHIRLALKRLDLDSSLESLVQLQRVVQVQIETTEITADLLSAKEFAVRAESDEIKPVLPEVATPLSSLKLDRIIGRDDIVQRIADYLNASRPRSVLLVGPSGVGKTAAFTDLFQRRTDYQLAGVQFFMTTGARIVSGMTGFGAWQERCELLCAEAASETTVVHLGNLAELNMVGRSACNNDGIAEFIAPYCQRGEIRVVVECTSEQAAVLDETHPELLATFARIDLEPPNAADTHTILRQFAPSKIGDDAVSEIVRLHERYATYSTGPGRHLRFLKNLLHDAEAQHVLNASEVTQAFAAETGLPLFLLDDDTPLDLSAMTAWFHERIRGQNHAVDVVTGLLGTVKARLVRPDRPIASLLFVGPTGVGKTETAKALAEFLYSNPDRMVRIDMSEYADASSVDRLAGGAASGEGVLTSRVREQPFGVVLLDEFEKAHPRFFDLLLQVLGEGRLTDSAGRLADFRNSVIIMTSNLGTAAFDRGTIGLARDHSAVNSYDEQHFVAEIQKAVRPEFFNRIDRVVPFLPLSAAALEEVARRELDRLSRREGLRYRRVELEFDSTVLNEVVRRGYEPRYGARPIKRAIDRHVLAPLAAALNEHPASAPVEARLQFSDGQLRATARQIPEAENASRRTDMLSSVDALQTLRRSVYKAQACSKAQSIRNRIDYLEHEERHAERRRKKQTAMQGSPSAATLAPTTGDIVRTQELNQLRPLDTTVQRLRTDVAALETLVLGDFWSGQPLDKQLIDAETGLLDGEFVEWLQALMRHGTTSLDRVTLALHSKTPEAIFRLGEAYLRVAREWGFAVTLWEFGAIPEDKLAKAKLRAISRISAQRKVPVDSIDPETVEQPLYHCRPLTTRPEDWTGLSGDSLAVAIHIQGSLAVPRFGGEAGLHEFRAENTTSRVLVENIIEQEAYEPARLPLHDPQAFKGPLLRLFDEKARRVEDRAARTSVHWPRHDLTEVLVDIIQERFRSLLFGQINQ